eukprot:CFRG6663T1
MEQVAALMKKSTGSLSVSENMDEDDKRGPTIVVKAGLLKFKRKIRSKENWVVRSFVLTDSALHWFSGGKNELLLRHRGKCLTAHMKDVAVVSKDESYCMFNLNLRDGSVYEFAVSSVEECESWVQALKTSTGVFSLDTLDNSTLNLEGLSALTPCEACRNMVITTVSTGRTLSPGETIKHFANSTDPLSSSSETDILIALTSTFVGNSIAFRMRRGNAIRLWCLNGVVYQITNPGTKKEQIDVRDGTTGIPVDDSRTFQCNITMSEVADIRSSVNVETSVSADTFRHVGITVVCMEITAWVYRCIPNAHGDLLDVLGLSRLMVLFVCIVLHLLSIVWQRFQKDAITNDASTSELWVELRLHSRSNHKLGEDENIISSPGTPLRRVESMDPYDPGERLLQQMKEKYPNDGDVTLRRFLKARNYNIKAAMAMRDEDLTFRDQIGPLDENQFVKMFKMGVSYLHGRAMDGTPINIIQVKNMNVKLLNCDEVQKLVIFVTDQIRSLCPAKESFTVIVDLEHFSVSKNVNIPLYLDAIALINRCLPEVLERVRIVNAPYMFKGVWTIVSKALDSRTIDKINFLGPKEYHKFLDFIEPENLPKRYGGTSTFEFNECFYSRARIGFLPLGVQDDLTVVTLEEALAQIDRKDALVPK